MFKLYHNIKTQEVAEAVNITISGSDATQIKRIKVFRISLGSNIYELQKKTNNSSTVWFEKDRFFREIWLGFPPDLQDVIDDVTVTIGSQQFPFSRAQIEKQWKEVEKKDSGVAALLQNNWLILKGPQAVAIANSNIPIIKNIINWPGDSCVLLHTFTFALMVVLLLVIAITSITIVLKWTIQYIKLYSYVPISIVFLLVFVFICFFLSPMLESQLYNDDLVYSAITKGFYRANGDPSLVSNITDHVKKGVVHGRFLILGTILHKTTFYFLNNVTLYKIYILLLVLINIILFAFFLKMYIKDNVILLTLLFMLPMFFQFRPSYHDPFLAYHGLQQHLFSLLLISNIFLAHYLENNKKLHLVSSVIFYFFTLMLYEIAIPMVVISLFFIYNRYGFSKRTIKIALPFLLLVFLICGYMFYLQSFVIDKATQYVGLKISINFLAIIKTYAIQLFSVMPLSFSLFYTRSPSLLEIFKNINIIYFITISIFFIIVTSAIIPKLNRSSFTYNPKLIIIGLLLFLLPGIPIAVSYKYQQELRVGLGYLPVYLQYFGLVLIFGQVVFLFMSYARRSSNALIHGYPLVFAIIYLIVVSTFFSNLTSIKQANKFSYPINVLRIALAENILSEADEDTILLLENKYLKKTGHYKYLFYEYLGRFISVYTVNEFINEIKTSEISHSLTLKDKKVYILKSPPADVKDAYILVGRISSIVFDNSGDSNIFISKCKYFTSNMHPVQEVSFKIQSIKAKETADTIIKSRGRYYSLYQVSFNDMHADFHSLKFF
jgi:hypothetical protein